MQVAALIDARRVGLEGQAADQAAEKHPRAELGLITQVFLPIQPRPACSANTRSCTGPLSTQIRTPRTAGLRRAHPLDERVEPLADNLVVVVAPRVARDDGVAGSVALERVRLSVL